MMRLAAAGIAAAILGGCEITEPVTCPGTVEPAIVVEILDAQTGEPVADSARGIVRDGVFQDSLVAHGFNSEMVMVSRRAAYEREGTYAVFVSHPHYELWAREDVRVRNGKCNVETVTLRAEMDRRAPAGGV